MKILFFVPYPIKESPSQRFRFEQYFSLLNERGIDFKILSFLTERNWKVFYKKWSPVQKCLSLISGIVRRFAGLFLATRYDFIFIHREMLPFGPPIFEWFIAKVFKKRIIYDFDDAIWLTDRKNESKMLSFLKWRSKVRIICQLSYKVSCGNKYLQGYALQYNSKSIINPTTVDTDTVHNPRLAVQSKKRGGITIGWTGSHSTLKYLSEIESILKEINLLHQNVRFLIIADQRPDIKLDNVDFIMWNQETEVKDLLQIDIGIMPLPNDEWAKGKCGFKAIQYLSLEIPAIVSDVGVNSTIVEGNISGFVCGTQSEWIRSVNLLIENEELRRQMGIAGRKKIIDNYSVSSNSSNFLSLFE